MTPSGDECPADELRRRVAHRGADRPRTGQMAGLEMLTFAGCVGSGVFFAGFLVRDTSPGRALAWASLAALVAALAVALMRTAVPPRVDPTCGNDDVEDEDDGGWDVANATMAAVVVPVFFVGALLVRQWPLVLVVGAMCVGASSVSGWDVAAAIACSLVLLTVLEVGVVWPLSRRWNLPLD